MPGSDADLRFMEWWDDAEPHIRSKARKYASLLAEVSGYTQDDIVQEVAVRMLLAVRRGTVTDSQMFCAYGINSASWAILDRLRKRSVVVRQLLAEREPVPVESDPATVASAREFAERFAALVATLPNRQRRVFEAKAEGLSDAEIAHELQIEPSTVRSLFRYAKGRLSLTIRESDS